jgi:OmpA-OmpF porin, OOP family
MKPAKHRRSTAKPDGIAHLSDPPNSAKVAQRQLLLQRQSAKGPMMKRFSTFVFCSAFAAVSFASAEVSAQTQSAHDISGPYVGIAFGAAFGNRETDNSGYDEDERSGSGTKIFAGYQFTEHFGVQAGYVHINRLNQNTGAGATLVKQTVTGQSTYLAGTARLPLGRMFALTAKAGVSLGRVTDADPSTTAGSLQGRKTSLMGGTGAEFILNRNVLFAVELESYGRIAAKVNGHTMTIGTRYTF